MLVVCRMKINQLGRVAGESIDFSKITSILEMVYNPKTYLSTNTKHLIFVYCLFGSKDFEYGMICTVRASSYALT
jgi:hypothetical protein